MTKEITKKCIAVGVVFTFLSVLMVCFSTPGTSDQNTELPEQPIKAIIKTAPTITLSIIKGIFSAYPTYLYTKVVNSDFPYPLYFRLNSQNETGIIKLTTVGYYISGYNQTCTQAVSGHTWWINGTGGYYKAVIQFLDGGLDACGDPTMKIYADLTINTNQSTYNTSSLLQYIGAAGGADEDWVMKVKSGMYYDYYHLDSPWVGSRYVRYVGDQWLASCANSAKLPPLFYMGPTGIAETVWGFTNDSRVDDTFLRVTMKFKSEALYPKTAPKTISMEIMNDTQLLSYDNASIFADMKNTYGIENVELHGLWMTPQTYDARSVACDVAIHNIRDYCHANGMGLGMYFGWLDFSDPSCNPFTTHNVSNEHMAQHAWYNYSTKWGDFVDFFYFDFSSVGFIGPTSSMANWSWWNYVLLDPIFQSINMLWGKTIYYNAGFESWWVGGPFIPVKIEGTNIATMTFYHDKEVAGDPVIHSLNYTSIIWNTPCYFEVDNTNDLLNMDNAREVIHLCYSWGMGLYITYDWGNTTGIAPYAKYLAGWKGNCNRTGDVPGVSGRSGIFESDPSLWVTDPYFSNVSKYEFVMMENKPYSLTVTMTEDDPVIFGASVFVMNLPPTDDWATFSFNIGGLTQGKAYTPILDGVVLNNYEQANRFGYLNTTIDVDSSVHVFQIVQITSNNDLFAIMIAIVMMGAILSMAMVMVTKR